MNTIKILSSLFICVLTILGVPPAVSAQISAATATTTKAIKHIDYYKVDVLTGDKILLSSEHYDEQGYMTKSYNYNTYPSGGKEEKNCTYDTFGTVKCITTDKSGEVTYSYEAKYQGESLVEEKTSYGRKEFSYDNNGQLVLMEEFDNDGGFSEAEKNELEYQAGTSNLKSINIFTKRGSGDFIRYGEDLYFYNDDGSLKQKSERTSFYHYQYSYDYHPNGNLKQKITLNGDNEKVITTCNEEGQRITEDILRRKDTTQDFEVDQKNTWFYDEQGNQILFKSFRNDNLSKKRIREITYY